MCRVVRKSELLYGNRICEELDGCSCLRLCATYTYWNDRDVWHCILILTFIRLFRWLPSPYVNSFVLNLFGSVVRYVSPPEPWNSTRSVWRTLWRVCIMYIWVALAYYISRREIFFHIFFFTCVYWLFVWVSNKCVCVFCISWECMLLLK